MKKTLPVTLLTLILAASLLASSCGNDTKDNDDADTNSAGDGTTAEQVDENAYPYEIKKLDGRELRFLNCVDEHWQGASQIIDYDQLSGETVADTVYKKNRDAEEKLGIKIAVTKEAVDQLHKAVSTAVMANDDIYDAVYGCINAFGTETDGKYVLNLNDIDSINFEDEWWNPSYAKSAIIDGDKLYVAVDYMNLNGYTWTDAQYFSKDLVTKYGLDMPYDFVRDGKWTLDRMAEYMKPAINLNGDESFTASADGNSSYGVCVQHGGGITSLAEGAGAFVVERDKDGIPAITQNTEKVVNAFEKLAGILSEDGACFMYNTPEYSSLVAFTEGRGMFYQGSLGNSLGDKMRASNIEYGIIPLPKYDEKQDQYYSMVSQYTLALSIPKTVADPETVGACLDYLEWASFKECIPVIQDALCYKGVRDDDSIEMLDIIRKTQYTDMGVLFGWCAEFIGKQSENVYNGKLQFASDFAAARSKIEENIAKSLGEMGING